MDTPATPSGHTPPTAADGAKLADIDLLSDSLGYAIKQAQVRSYEYLYEIFGADTLTPARMTALCLIGTRPGINQSSLAEILRINRASVVKVIDALQALDYVQRDALPADRRSYALRVTPAGHAELRRLTALTRTYEQALAADLTAQERRTLFRLLEKVARRAPGPRDTQDRDET